MKTLAVMGTSLALVLGGCMSLASIINEAELNAATKERLAKYDAANAAALDTILSPAR